LSLVWPKFAYAILMDKEHGAINHCQETKAVEQVAGLYNRVIHGEFVSDNEWRTAAAARTAAAWAAAWAAWAAAWAAARAAAAAAAEEAAAAAAAWAVSRGSHWKWMADLLIKLLSECKPKRK
jgi:hypothetical protein